MNLFAIVQKIFNHNNINYSIIKKDKKIKVEMPVQESVFCKIVHEITNAFGEPRYVDLYYGYIWHTNEGFLSFNVIETAYNSEAMYLYIFKKLPFSKRIDYTDYVNLDSMIADTLKEYNFFCDHFIHYSFIGNEYLYFGHGINHECIISLKRNSLRISLSETQKLSETTYRSIPAFNQKFKVKRDDLPSIKRILSECLSFRKNTGK